jgi:hypothetical protein
VFPRGRVSAAREAGTPTVDPQPGREARAVACLLLAAALVAWLPACGPPQLDSRHQGWQRAGCGECHPTGQDDHFADRRPWECAECHGTNGAPRGHGGSPPCLGCHQAGGGQVAAPAHEPPAAFPDPRSCRTCHP